MPTPAEIVAALAGPERLPVFARVVLADEPPAAPADGAGPARHVRRLVRDGLVDTATGRPTARPEAFREALAGPRRPAEPDADPRTAAFFTAGRLTTLPARPAARRVVLTRIALDLFAADTSYPEPVVNEKLAAVPDDYPMLCRHLVDFGLLQRSPDGRAHSLAEPAR
jgi:hypothetical protein